MLVDAPDLVVDQNGTASSVRTLRNDTGATISGLRLTLSDFTHTRPDGRTQRLRTTRTLAPVDEKDGAILKGESPLPDQATLHLRVTVTGVWAAGESDAILKNGTAEIPILGGKSALKAVRMPTAYNVQIISSTPETPEIHVVRGAFFGVGGTRALVGLKNPDPFAYDVAWRLRLNGHVYEGGPRTIELKPDGKTYVDLTPVDATSGFPIPNWFTSGTLKDEVLRGDLVLQPVLAGDGVPQPPAQHLPVTFRLSYWGETTKQFFNVGCIFLLLTVGGGVFSLWVRSGMPNTTGALALRRRIDELETKIGGLGPSIDSRCRVLLEAHLPGLRRELFSMPWVFPSFATTLEQLTKRVDMVQPWVEIAYNAATVLQQMGQHIPRIPPTVMRGIRERCAQALTPIESGFTTTEELAAMKASLNSARGLLTVSMESVQNGDLEKEIADREARCATEDFTSLSEAHPEFAGLFEQAARATKTPLSPANYVERDVRSLKVDLLWKFHQRRQQLEQAPAPSEVAEALGRITLHRSRLMRYLVADTRESLLTAFLIVQEMSQDIYSDALAAPLKDVPPSISITTDPGAVKAESPIRLALRFRRQLLNEAAARDEWTCTWEFGDDTPTEEGWEVFHSFNAAGARSIQVTIRDSDGHLVIAAPITKTITVGNGMERSALERGWRFVKFEPETRLELIRLAIVLALALLGLMTTAREQAQNLTFLEAVVVVVALGFGADTIKNLIVQRSGT